MLMPGTPWTSDAKELCKCEKPNPTVYPFTSVIEAYIAFTLLYYRVEPILARRICDGYVINALWGNADLIFGCTLDFEMLFENTACRFCHRGLSNSFHDNEISPNALVNPSY